MIDKIVCLGKNYLEHAKELARDYGDQVPELPVLFLKPPSCLVQVGAWGESLKIKHPKLFPQSGPMHHECEVVFSIDSSFRPTAFTLGLDLTLRDTQMRLKKAGSPWEMSKVFEGSAIIGPWIPIHELAELQAQKFEFYLEGTCRQTALLSQMRLSIDQAIAYAGQYFPLRENDIFFTGSPEGVGPLSINQKCTVKWGKFSYSVCWT